MDPRVREGDGLGVLSAAHPGSRRIRSDVYPPGQMTSPRLAICLMCPKAMNGILDSWPHSAAPM